MMGRDSGQRLGAPDRQTVNELPRMTQFPLRSIPLTSLSRSRSRAFSLRYGAITIGLVLPADAAFACQAACSTTRGVELALISTANRPVRLLQVTSTRASARALTASGGAGRTRRAAGG